MNKIALTFVASLAVATSALAGHEMKETKEYKPVIEPCFNDQEFQLDVFGTYNWITDGGSGLDDGPGGGIGLNYFFVRYVGIGVDTNLFEGGVHGLWNFTGSLILRYPIEAGGVCLAPYIFGGGGYAVNGQGEGTAHAGGGLEWRVVPQRIGIFTEGRYTWSDDHGDAAQVRAGVRFVF